MIPFIDAGVTAWATGLPVMTVVTCVLGFLTVPGAPVQGFSCVSGSNMEATRVSTRIVPMEFPQFFVHSKPHSRLLMST